MDNNNKYFGIRWGVGITFSIFLILMLFLPPYFIKLYRSSLEDGGYLQEMIQGGYFPEIINILMENINLELLQLNAWIFCFILVPWLLMKKKTLARIIVNVLAIVLLIYAFFIGTNLFTFGLPCTSFATLNLNMDFLGSMMGDLGLNMQLYFNYTIFAIMILLTASLGTVKSIFQYLQRTE